MTTKLEALRLADELEEAAGEYWRFQKSTGYGAAAELRRLHAENEVMRNVANRGGHMAVAMSRIADLESQRDALLEALKLAWPIIEKEKFMQDGCYGKNFIQSKAERARKAYEAARAAIKAVEEGK